jgi:hypothetical protein
VDYTWSGFYTLTYLPWVTLPGADAPANITVGVIRARKPPQPQHVLRQVMVMVMVMYSADQKIRTLNCTFNLSISNHYNVVFRSSYTSTGERQVSRIEEMIKCIYNVLVGTRDRKK